MVSTFGTFKANRFDTDFVQSRLGDVRDAATPPWVIVFMPTGRHYHFAASPEDYQPDVDRWDSFVEDRDEVAAGAAMGIEAQGVTTIRFDTDYVIAWTVKTPSGPWPSQLERIHVTRMSQASQAVRTLFANMLDTEQPGEAIGLTFLWSSWLAAQLQNALIFGPDFAEFNEYTRARDSAYEWLRDHERTANVELKSLGDFFIQRWVPKLRAAVAV